VAGGGGAGDGDGDLGAASGLRWAVGGATGAGWGGDAGACEADASAEGAVSGAGTAELSAAEEAASGDEGGSAIVAGGGTGSDGLGEAFVADASGPGLIPVRCVRGHMNAVTAVMAARSTVNAAMRAGLRGRAVSVGVGGRGPRVVASRDERAPSSAGAGALCREVEGGCVDAGGSLTPSGSVPCGPALGSRCVPCGPVPVGAAPAEAA
jgi:hypothetical protein